MGAIEESDTVVTSTTIVVGGRGIAKGDIVAVGPGHPLHIGKLLNLQRNNAGIIATIEYWEVTEATRRHYKAIVGGQTCFTSASLIKDRHIYVNANRGQL